jgi:hypothetical protein
MATAIHTTTNGKDMIVAKFSASSLGIVLDTTVNTKEVEVNFYDLIDSTTRSSLIKENANASDILAAMRDQVRALESSAWEQVKALLEPAAEALVLGHLVGINAISAGENVYTLLEAVNRQYELFTLGKQGTFIEVPKGWASYTVKTSDGPAERWLAAPLVEELEAIRAALPEGFLGMSIAKQRTLAAKAMAYEAPNTKTFTV